MNKKEMNEMKWINSSESVQSWMNVEATAPSRGQVSTLQSEYTN